jgi:hypothetical protein
MSAQQVGAYVVAGRRRPGDGNRPRVEARELTPTTAKHRCQWTLKGDEFQTWCGFAFIDDGESDPRHFWFCPYCGGPLRVVTAP